MSARDTFAFFRNIDIFGAPVPSFNIGGQKTVKTAVGASISIIIMILVLAFGLLKMRDLYERKNPLITTNITPLKEGANFKTD